MTAVVFNFAVNAFPGDQFADIEWRVMFFTGIIPGLVALFIRIKMDESLVWKEKQLQKRTVKNPFKKLFLDKTLRKQFFFALVIMTGLMYAYYTTIELMRIRPKNDFPD